MPLAIRIKIQALIIPNFEIQIDRRKKIVSLAAFLKRVYRPRLLLQEYRSTSCVHAGHRRIGYASFGMPHDRQPPHWVY